MSSLQFYLEDVWTKVKDNIETHQYFDDQIYKTYVEKTSLASISEKKAIIKVADYIQKIILSENTTVFDDSIREVLGKDSITCEFYLENEIPTDTITPAIKPPVVVRDDGIISSMTFENFVVGTSNKESHSAALGCAYRPGLYYTPLFIFGNSGLGKTHLLNAIGNYIKKLNPDSKVLYTSSTNFVRQVANSIQNRSIEDFKEEMATLDVLLIDDIQFLAGKEKSHEIFFNIFNDLIYNKKQIVITSDRLPNEIKGLEDRLISRFHSGLSVGIDSPEFETARAILDMKIQSKSQDPTIFDDSVLDYVATHFSKDVRVLEGALNRLLFYSIEFSNTDHVNLDVALAAFKSGGSTSSSQEIDVKTIKRIVADYYGITQSQIVSKARTKVISNARHIAIYLCRKHLDLAYLKIGDEFGKRDHSTIISACDKIEKKLKTDQLLAKAIYEIENKF